ncbi:ATP-dependent RNA helicase dbp10 [Taphrina deformans PYCC 5710]|uniref:RNA helicase n=1 Tax=Taphrina deformans (strain PYCC 5710 / ATCC 11124 / CBS 356.35 / IMI 108563 / JCM 9778 / NBRC 8474) TaxID=1097556 RepID=R4X9D3_TAPDE|nr:ATP-dependent RNA helicase dbp10 [Taphrina deformans PYCC 5710]|eukprot:CCG82030.1 ATP-dependent RNA helicase dbp10 [Taphrina deformans PYCC 5710]
MRAASPVESEADLDFTSALVAEDDGSLSDDSDSAFIDAAQSASNRKTKPKNGQKSGGTAFQSMGLLPSLSKAIAHKGFKVPTPIQRKTIPLILEHRDVVGMARTGSGKTAAFVIPMIQHLKMHTAKTGARAVIMSPSRELALQTLKVVKELGKGTDLKTVLLVGGDSLEEHFAAMSGNPDIIIATPGRFLHIKVEMKLPLSSVEYIVFDEADRLFEMGFAAQLTEILHTLPTTRQTLLFSATLPVSLVEFAKAGLTDPVLVRLDVDSKISSDLESAFFSVQTTEKEGALLYILSDIIKLDTASALTTGKPQDKDAKKRRRKEEVAPNATIIFTCTKHHVDYIANLLTLAGYKCSYIYGALDQTARRNQIDDFKSGRSNILVVTDVAARGIDIPILANVINYDFPAQPKIFVHRVGRTARAGKRGWSYSLVRAEDCAYLLDLQLFLSRRLVTAHTTGEPIDYTKDVVLGALPRDGSERGSEWANKTIHDDADLMAMKKVAGKGEKLYLRTRPTASVDSIRRAKDVVKSLGWVDVTPLLAVSNDSGSDARIDMLKRVGNFRPVETVFEIGHRGNNEAATIMRTRRDKFLIDPAKSIAHDTVDTLSKKEPGGEGADANGAVVEEMANESELEDAFPASNSLSKASLTGSNRTRKRKRGATDFKDSENYMSHYDPSANAMDHAYDVNSFAEAARHETLDLATDEGKDAKQNRGKKWDPKQKKFINVANETDGSKGHASKMIRGESGVKIPASYSAGRYAAWKNATRNKGGEVMPLDAQAQDRRFKHRAVQAPKPADKFRDDYHAKKKQNAAAREKGVGVQGVRNELKDKHQIRKARNEKVKRQEKNARPAARGGSSSSSSARGGSSRGGRGGGRGRGGSGSGGRGGRR